MMQMENELDWLDDGAQGVAFGAFYIGYAASQVVGGYLSYRHGPKPVLLASIVLWSIATLLTPGAAQTSLGALVGARIALGLGEGLCLPSLHALASAWVPPSERSTASAFMTSGQFVGTVAVMLCAPMVATSWPSVFYLFGLVGIAVALLFAALATSDPQSHSCVSPAELKHIMANRSGVVRAGSCTPSSDAPKPAHAHIPTRDPSLQVGTLRSTSDGPISNRGAGLAKRSAHAHALPWRSFFMAKPVRPRVEPSLTQPCTWHMRRFHVAGDRRVRRALHAQLVMVPAPLVAAGVPRRPGRRYP